MPNFIDENENQAYVWKHFKNFSLNYLDPALQRLPVLDLKGILDVSKVDLRPGDQDPNELTVGGSQPSHGLVQTLGEEFGPAANALHWKAKKLKC